MATFTELCNDVYTITKRPDLVDATKLAVKQATLKLHHSDYYYKDLVETGIQFGTSDYIQQADVKNFWPRFRTLKYFRRYQDDSAMEFFEVVPPELIVDSYKIDRVNIAYVAGSVLQIRSRYPLQYALISFYQHPDITEAGFSSWIAQDHPFAIQFEAARFLFKSIGFDEQSAAFEKLANEQLAEIKISNISAVGY